MGSIPMLSTTMDVKNYPFPHFIIDDLLPSAEADAIANQFPDPSSSVFQWESNDSNSIKMMCQNAQAIAKFKALREVIDFFNGPFFISTIEDTLGIPNLIPDPMLCGGGLHLTKTGGFLRIHADFNVAETLPDLHRRVNLIYYLNKDWLPEYDGALELWDTELTKAQVMVEPIFNRLVVFNTQPPGRTMAYHGQPRRLQCPEGVYRKSIALYYYTAEKSDNILSDKHPTLYSYEAL